MSEVNGGSHLLDFLGKGKKGLWEEVWGIGWRAIFCEKLKLCQSRKAAMKEPGYIHRPGFWRKGPWDVDLGTSGL